MVLNSLPFAAFFLIFLAVLLVLPKKLRRLWLFAGNCLFYLTAEPGAFLLLLASSLLIWLSGLGIEKFSESKTGMPKDGSPKRAELFLCLIPILWNVGLLIFFKYAGLIGNVLKKTDAVFSAKDILIPLGLSFYTLRCISYVRTVWKRELDAVRNPLDVFNYVSFFPQIISGPIEKPVNFFCEFEAFSQKNLRDFERIWQGFLLFVWGLFQKIVLAERLSLITAHLYGSFQQYGFWELLFASAAYTLQIYCDFGGYSDMSRGVSAMLGFSTMRNFRQPYLAAGIKSFWRRWHISLTDWLTETIYIPLGGSRKGLLRKYVNVIIVFLISGLWHGSTLNFVFWGLLHAVFQIAEDMWERRLKPLPGWIRRLITLAEVNFAWIFFNAGGLNRGFRIIRQMFSRFSLPAAFDPGLIPGNLVVLAAGLIILTMVDVLHEKKVPVQQKTAALPLPLRWLIILGLFWSVIMLGIYGIGYDTSGFIYARF